MEPARLGRRDFLAAAGGMLLATALPSIAAAGTPTKKRAELSALVLSSDLYASSAPQRFVFAIARGPHYASFDQVDVAFAAPDADQGTVMPTTLYKRGLPHGRGIYRIDTTFPTPGAWKAIAISGRQHVEFAVQINPAPVAPIVGAPAPRVPSPTPTDTLGVKPICTRHPACDLHQASLANVIGAGVPVVAMFATPALCQSGYCGPVLDELLAVVPHYQNRARFVHVEIYKNNRGATLAPTVKAWGLPSEPWLYTIDPAGTITNRLDGAIGAQEIEDAVTRLLA